jgi:hypothetical protein
VKLKYVAELVVYDVVLRVVFVVFDKIIGDSEWRVMWNSLDGKQNIQIDEGTFKTQLNRD